MKMNTHSFIDDGFTFERIAKRRARIAYNNGLSVLFAPIRCPPFSLASRVTRISKDQCLNINTGMPFEFDELVKLYESKHCINKQTGHYASFYIPVRLVDQFTGESPTKHTLGTIEEYDHRFVEKEKQRRKENELLDGTENKIKNRTN